MPDPKAVAQIVFGLSQSYSVLSVRANIYRMPILDADS